MNVVVAGGTGLLGRCVVAAVERAGHAVTIAARSTGVDLVTGAGLDRALAGADAVIDVSNGGGLDADAARAFFGCSTRQLLAAEVGAGVGHHVVVSVEAVDRVQSNGHFAGKRLQERLVLDGPVPATIVRSTQFHDFGAMVVDWTRQGDVAVVPPLLIQPVDRRDLAGFLADVTAGPPAGGVISIAGPEPHDLVDMARRTLTVREQPVQLRPSWNGPFGVEMAGDVLLPGDDACRTLSRFETWLQTAAHDERTLEDA
jgi:uncharacterized protein YbjT (DUF2867 family)